MNYNNTDNRTTIKTKKSVLNPRLATAPIEQQNITTAYLAVKQQQTKYIKKTLTKKKQQKHNFAREIK